MADELKSSKPLVQRLREYYAEELAEISTLGEAADEIEELRAALERSPCPRPLQDDDGTVLCCVTAGHCGCENAALLRGADETESSDG